MRYLTGLFFFGFTVVVVTGLQMVVVVVGDSGAVVVVVAPGTVVEVDSTVVVVVVVTVVVVVGVHVGLGVGFFFTVVVVTGGRTGFLCRGRRVLTVRVIVACQRTRVPAAGDWWSTTIHLPSELPGPRVLKKSCARFIAANVRALESPMTRGTRRGAWGFAFETRIVAWKCHGTTVPALGDCPTA